MAEDQSESSQPKAVPSSSRDSGQSTPVSESFSRQQSTARLGSPVPSSLPAGSPAVRQIPTLAQLGSEEQSTSQTPLAGRGDGQGSLPGPAESALSSAYHPQTDGQTERINQEVEQYLRLFCDHCQDDWVDWVSLAAFSYNIKRHSATGKSPFKLVFGQHPRAFPGVNPSSPSLTLEERLEKQCTTLDEVRASLEIARRHMGEIHQDWRTAHPGFNKGDLVWLDGKNLWVDLPSTKLAPRRYGSFPIIKKLSKVAYRLHLPDHWWIHNVFHASLLTPVTSSSRTSQKLSAPFPELIDRNDIYVYLVLKHIYVYLVLKHIYSIYINLIIWYFFLLGGSHAIANSKSISKILASIYALFLPMLLAKYSDTYIKTETDSVLTQPKVKTTTGLRCSISIKKTSAVMPLEVIKSRNILMNMVMRLIRRF